MLVLVVRWESKNSKQRLLSVVVITAVVIAVVVAVDLFR